MSNIKRCPRCKLVNPENGLRCDCGYDFEAQVTKESLLGDKERRVSSTTRLTTFIIDATLIQLPFLLMQRMGSGAYQATEYGISLGSGAGNPAPNILSIKLTIPVFGYAAFWYPSLWMLAATFTYYFLFEYFMQRTPGKILTKSRVETQHGSKPTARDILLRTLIRYVPCEPFSGFRSSGQCWHDSWSKTRVVNG